MLYFELKGKRSDRIPLVLLHGFLESSTMWNGLDLDQFSEVLLIDLPGHGKSAFDPGESSSMKTMADSVLNVIRSAGFSSYDVVGHSMGGYVALELARIDSNCQKTILLNSNMWTDSPSKQVDRRRVAELVKTKKEIFVREAIPNLFERPENLPEFVHRLMEEAMMISSEAIGAASIAMSEREDFVEKVKRKDFNVYVIQGKNDVIVDFDTMEGIMSDWSERFFVVESGHMAHVEAKDEVLRILELIRG